VSKVSVYNRACTEDITVTDTLVAQVTNYQYKTVPFWWHVPFLIIIKSSFNSTLQTASAMENAGQSSFNAEWSKGVQRVVRPFLWPMFSEPFGYQVLSRPVSEELDVTVGSQLTTLQKLRLSVIKNKILVPYN
jgi:hypothetical protein